MNKFVYERPELCDYDLQKLYEYLTYFTEELVEYEVGYSVYGQTEFIQCAREWIRKISKTVETISKTVDEEVFKVMERTSHYHKNPYCKCKEICGEDRLNPEELEKWANE